MRQLCRSARVHYCDILGHPMEAVARVSGSAAQMRPGARPVLDDQYFRRISAIEFAVRFDDGVPAGLHDAEIVLVGVSRTSKTPLSMYLGYLGYKTANVPIVQGIEPPKELFEIEPARMVGLTIEAERLAEIRRSGRAGSAARAPQLHGARLDLRGARRGGRHPAPPEVPGHRHHRAVDRGDRRAGDPSGRAAG